MFIIFIIFIEEIIENYNLQALHTLDLPLIENYSTQASIPSLARVVPLPEPATTLFCYLLFKM